jgi:transposase-like protein
MAKTPRIPIPPEVRKYVFERDRYQCQSCGKTQLETQVTSPTLIRSGYSVGFQDNPAIARGGSWL